ncbi:MAG: hypothetical protein GYA71_12130 [Bacteroidales bacterium]|nr:hypothetical protein [Bacteroidales bacterium]
MKKLYIPFLLFIALFTACNKGEPDPDPEPEPSGVTPAMARDTLNDLMKQWYLWYDLLPTVNKEDYADPYELLEALR